MKKYVCALLSVLIMLMPVSAIAEAGLGVSYPSWATADTTFAIPEGVSIIEEGAFEGLSAIKDVFLPESVEKVCKNAFANCENLARVCVMNPNAVIEEGAFGEDSENIIIIGSSGSNAESYAKKYSITFQTIIKHEKLLTTARKYLGTAYSTHDCVTYLGKCYREAYGISLPGTCYQFVNTLNGNKIAGKTQKIKYQLPSEACIANQDLEVEMITDINKLQTGDILCWCDDTYNCCTHVGIYIGDVSNLWSDGPFYETYRTYNTSSKYGYYQYAKVIKNSSSGDINLVSGDEIVTLEKGDTYTVQGKSGYELYKDGVYVADSLGGGAYNVHLQKTKLFIESSSGAGKVRFHWISSGWYTKYFICAWRIIN